MGKVYRGVVDDKNLGRVYVVESDKSMTITNTLPSKDNRWVKEGNTYRNIPTPTRRLQRMSDKQLIREFPA